MLGFIQTLVKFTGFMMLITTGITLFEERDYIVASELFSIFLLSLLISYLLTKLIEKKAYGINQKEYGVVIVSDKIIESYEEMDEAEFEKFVHPFEKETELFVNTEKVGFFYEYTLKQWNDMFQEEKPVEQDPTFLVVTGNKDAKLFKAMTNPFLVASKPSEVVRFLEEHR